MTATPRGGPTNAAIDERLVAAIAAARLAAAATLGRFNSPGGFWWDAPEAPRGSDGIDAR
jgi:hypothetical protein